MKQIRRSMLIALAMLLSTSATSFVRAQAPAGETPVAAEPAPAPTSSGGSARRDSSNSSGSGIALEFQGRLSLLSVLNDGFPRFVPPVALGVRLLDGRLYAGLGLAYDSYRAKVCSGSTCTSNTNGQLFGVAPIVTFDVYSNGAAHLYPLLSLTLARNDVLSPGTGTMRRDHFVFGANIGAGIRGDIGEAVSIGSEWGWGFLYQKESNMGTTLTQVPHGFFGTINLSARIGL